MSFSDRLAELYELFTALGGAVLILIGIAFAFGRLGSKPPSDTSKIQEPMQSAAASNTSTTKEQTNGEPPTVQAIYIAPSAGKPVERVTSVKAVAGRGLVGDRYYNETGRWSGTDDSEVTLIAQEDLDNMSARSDVHVQNGEHRRNIITGNLPLEALTGKRFYIGSALFGYDRPRPPCTYIKTITEDGMAKALGRNSGICARCIKSGTIQEGDQIRIVQITVWDALRYRAALIMQKWHASGHDDHES